MRQVTRKGLMTMAAATGVIAAAGGTAHADSGAHGSSSDSPGVLSGNTVQAPVHVPVNVCGNTVDVVGILNPAMGNACANQGGGASGGHGDSGGYGDSGGRDGSRGGAHAGGHASDSPGVASGNHVEVPIDVPVNVCGNTIDVVGALNPSIGNDCGNGGGGGDHSTPPDDHETPPGEPGTPETPDGPGGSDGPDGGTPEGSPHDNRPDTQTVAQPRGDARLAETGSELPLGLALPVGAGALLAGTVLYRKARASA
ncbi:chaplin [Streptomyces sp. AC512_CC834]|uniref:chaplin n=1 Tax=Streptomyces sp. AC512_CC834 TaxID=2823691 RepID=UPI001C2589C2|nr:chaplin [Streptomyces sp. AC512_CC834]